VAAKDYVVKQEVRKLVPYTGISLEERWNLRAKYAGIRDKLDEDRQEVLKTLIHAKATRSTKELERLGALFANLEEELNRKLVPLIIEQYKCDWQSALDQLKSQEGIKKEKGPFVIGDLLKLYKRIILEQDIIEIGPLSKAEFSSIMDTAPMIRNKLAHRNVKGDLEGEGWDDLFEFFSKFVPIHSRLLRYLDSLTISKPTC